MNLQPILSLALAATLLASCGPKTLVLPEDPVERAATCGAVAAAAARSTTDVSAPLSLEAIAGVLHYPMLAASSGEAYSPDTATKVQERMAELQDAVVESDWREAIPACRSAFPATAAEEIRLPDASFDAQLGCDELGDFLRSSIEGREEYAEVFGEYRQLSSTLEPALASGLRSRAGSDSGRQQDERRKALAVMAKAGPPAAVMRECLTRFG